MTIKEIKPIKPNSELEKDDTLLQVKNSSKVKKDVRGRRLTVKDIHLGLTKDPDEPFFSYEHRGGPKSIRNTGKGKCDDKFIIISEELADKFDSGELTYCPDEGHAVVNDNVVSFPTPEGHSAKTSENETKSMSLRKLLLKGFTQTDTSIVQGFIQVCQTIRNNTKVSIDIRKQLETLNESIASLNDLLSTGSIKTKKEEPIKGLNESKNKSA